MIEEAPIGKVYDARLVKRLLRYLRPYRAWVAASLCLLLVHSVLGIAGPYLTKVAIDHSLSPQPGETSLLDPWLPADRWNSLQLIVLIFLCVQVVGFVFRAAQIHAMNYTGQRVMFDLRNQIFQHLQGMGVRFYDGNPVGRLVTRVTTDVDTLNELFTSGVVAIAGDLITLLFILGVMIHLSPQLTLVLMAVAPLVLVVTLWFRRRARQSYRDVRLAVAKINSFLQEHFSGIAVVQIFNHEGRSWEQFNQVNSEHREAQYQAIRAHAYFLPLVEWLGVLGLAVMLFYGGYLASTTQLTVGVVVAFLMYGTRVFRPLQDLSDKYNILQAAMASAERIFGLLDTPADESLGAAEPAPARPVSLAAAAGTANGKSQTAAVANPRVEFRNVWFAYKGEEWVLRDVSLTVEPGEMVAIVGHTGAGKTTLISLLLRFYEVQKGEILVGGRDVREWPLADLRRQFGVVLQDPYLFSGTIESNIRLRGNGVPEQRLREVIREVNLETFVNSLPGGLQEPILERGASLSSGQKQLLSFARALTFNPRFLILDEATSSVDTETEFKIREALSRMLAGHTSIVIAHRLSTIQKAQRIVVMHKGQVRETGSHQDLLANRGIYYKLYQLQYREQEAQAGAFPEPEAELPAAAEPEALANGASANVAAPPPPVETATAVETASAVQTEPPVEPQPPVEAPPADAEPPVDAEPIAALEPTPIPPPESDIPEVAIQQPLAQVNGSQQASADAESAQPATRSRRKRGGGARKRPRKKKGAAAESSPEENASRTAQLDLSWEGPGASAEAAAPPKSPGSSPTATAPKSKSRRRSGRRKRK